MAADCGWVLLHWAALLTPPILSPDQRCVQDSGVNLHFETSACGPEALRDHWPNTTVCNRLTKGVTDVTSMARALHSVENTKRSQAETIGNYCADWNVERCGGFISLNTPSNLLSVGSACDWHSGSLGTGKLIQKGDSLLSSNAEIMLLHKKPNLLPRTFLIAAPSLSHANL